MLAATIAFSTVSIYVFRASIFRPYTLWRFDDGDENDDADEHFLLLLLSDSYIILCCYDIPSIHPSWFTDLSLQRRLNTFLLRARDSTVSFHLGALCHLIPATCPCGGFAQSALRHDSKTRCPRSLTRIIRVWDTLIIG